jgi:hypothetical protein
MKLQSAWVTRGYFDVGDPGGGKSLTQRVRGSIATALGLKPSDVQLASYPVGPAWRYALWWREGEADYAEAQFFAGLSPEHPILSAGISVEKGLEAGSVSIGDSRRMNRASWDWPRFLSCSPELLAKEVPACSDSLGRPVVVRFRASGRGVDSEGQRESYTFLYDAGRWFQRHKGTADPGDICRLVTDLDSRTDWWVQVHVCCDLTAAEVGEMDDENLARLLVAFAPMRARIRASAVTERLET